MKSNAYLFAAVCLLCVVNMAVRGFTLDLLTAALCAAGASIAWRLLADERAGR